MNAGNIVDAFVSDSKWNSVPAKRLFTSSKEINQGMKESNRLALTMKGVINRSLDDLQGLQSSDYSVYQIFEKDDLVFKLIDLENIKTSRVGIVHERGIMSPAYIRVSASSNSIYPRFYYWYFFALYLTNIYNKLGGGVRQNLTAGDLLEIPVPLIDISLQKQVSTFLDRETQRIDSLIEEKQTFIKLLKEKRQALISHVVTKGLNPNVEMQDSGIEWIGQVPKHWVCPSYRYVCEIYRGKFTHRPRNDPAMFDGIHPFIQTGDVARAKNIISSYSQTLSDAGTEVSQLIPKGTLMMVITGAKIGSTAILGFDSYAPDSVVGFKAKPTIELSYLKYSLMAALPALEQTSIQSTQPNLNIDRIGSLKTPLPPLDEQVSIVNYIENQLSNFETVLSAVEDSIKLLLERRTSLISAAVTGKIDVREAV
ncbi:restriction endonuclease subunit S [Shewanella bicestrii]|uniref:restriction endonuclease subunit S n=1 Tax=Proteus terrae TaxID=1574161 RepID=UPI0032DA82A7